MTKKIKIELDDQIACDNGYGEVDADIQLQFEVTFEQHTCTTEKGDQALWQFKCCELTDAYVFFIDSDGGCSSERPYDDMSESDEKHYSEIAIKQAWEKL